MQNVSWPRKEGGGEPWDEGGGGVGGHFWSACRMIGYHLPALAGRSTMRFGSTAKVLLKCKLKYYRISECAAHACHNSRMADNDWDGTQLLSSLGREYMLRPFYLGLCHKFAGAQCVSCSFRLKTFPCAFLWKNGSGVSPQYRLPLIELLLSVTRLVSRNCKQQTSNRQPPSSRGYSDQFDARFVRHVLVEGFESRHLGVQSRKLG